MQLPATLTQTEVPALLESLCAAARRGEALDASGVERFDSAALALILQARAAASAAKQSWNLRNAPQPLQQLARLYGVSDLLFAAA